MNNNPRDRGGPVGSVISGGIPVGNRTMYPDLNGNLHPTPGQAINSNQRVESDYSRGSSGGCGQDPSRVPNPNNGR